MVFFQTLRTYPSSVLHSGRFTTKQNVWWHRAPDEADPKMQEKSDK